jgi:hypothetical protein
MNEDESCKSNCPLLHLYGRICNRVNSLQENTSLLWKIRRAFLRWRSKLSQDHRYTIVILKNINIIAKNISLKKIHLKFKHFQISKFMLLKDIFLTGKIQSLVLSSIKPIKRFGNSYNFNFLDKVISLKELTLESMKFISNEDIFKLSQHLINLKTIRLINCKLLTEECLNYFPNCDTKLFIIYVSKYLLFIETESDESCFESESSVIGGYH